ncbi:MAG: DUF2277 domain-containing protein [Acidimicrobiales bacterium]
MCRSIVRLQRPDSSDPAPASSEEIRRAALQFVRKVSGSRKPSRANDEAFEVAVSEIAVSVERLLGAWVSPGRVPAGGVPSSSYFALKNDVKQ